MAYVLDTNHCIYLLNGLEKKYGVRSLVEQRVIKAVFELEDEPLYMAEATLGELYYGAARSARPKHNLEKIQTLTTILTPLHTTKAIWKLFGDTKAALRKKGTPISDFDLLIACTAKMNECVLVTNDKDFESLPRSFRRINWAGK